MSYLTLKCNFRGKRGPRYEYSLLLISLFASTPNKFIHSYTNLIAICEAPFLDLAFSIMNDIVSTKIYDKRGDSDFEIVNFPFLDEDVPHSPSYDVYISQLIRFCASMC